MKFLTKIDRYWHTLKYISFKQKYYRGRRILRHKWWKLTNARVPLLLNTTPIKKNIAPLFSQSFCDLSCCEKYFEPHLQTVKDAHCHQFTFLNETHKLAAPINWQINSVSRLWRFNLHYFDTVFSFLICNQIDVSLKPAELFSSLVSSWINENKSLQGDGWHPYTLSLRIVNWIHGMLGGLITESVLDEVTQSLYAQTNFLSQDLEFDVRGNHLLENARALIFAGLLFEGNEAYKWFNQGMSILKAETEEQIELDGGHFERCPSYHWVVTKNYLEIALWLKRNKKLVPEWLDGALYKMLEFGLIITPVDGNEPLLKDSAWSASPDSQSVLNSGSLYFQESKFKSCNILGLYERLLFHKDDLALARQKNSSFKCIEGIWYLEQSGYLVTRTHNSHFIFDVGQVSPDYLPAHAHADIFTYELILNNKRIIVDSGVYKYQAGNWRDYFRSTRAHNTVSVNGVNQSEVWHSFRVARRAEPKVCFFEQKQAHTLIQAYHNGYQRLDSKVIHRRTVLTHNAGLWIFVDELFSTSDLHITAQNYIHFHPDISPKFIQNQHWKVVDDVSLIIADQPNLQTNQFYGELDCLQGWYSSHFGAICPNHVLGMKLKGKNLLRFAYAIVQYPYIDLSFDLDSFDIIIDARIKSHNMQLCIPQNNMHPSVS